MELHKVDTKSIQYFCIGSLALFTKYHFSSGSLLLFWNGCELFTNCTLSERTAMFGLSRVPSEIFSNIANFLLEVRIYDKILRQRKLLLRTCTKSLCERNLCLLNDVLHEISHFACASGCN